MEVYQAVAVSRMSLEDMEEKERRKERCGGERQKARATFPGKGIACARTLICYSFEPCSR